MTHKKKTKILRRVNGYARPLRQNFTVKFNTKTNKRKVRSMARGKFSKNITKNFFFNTRGLAANVKFPSVIVSLACGR